MFNALLKEVVPKNLKIPVNIAFYPLSGCKESLMGGSGGGAVSTLDSREKLGQVNVSKDFYWGQGRRN